MDKRRGSLHKHTHVHTHLYGWLPAQAAPASDPGLGLCLSLSPDGGGAVNHTVKNHESISASSTRPINTPPAPCGPPPPRGRRPCFTCERLARERVMTHSCWLHPPGLLGGKSEVLQRVYVHHVSPTLVQMFIIINWSIL